MDKYTVRILGEESYYYGSGDPVVEWSEGKHLVPIREWTGLEQVESWAVLLSRTTPSFAVLASATGYGAILGINSGRSLVRIDLSAVVGMETELEVSDAD